MDRWRNSCRRLHRLRKWKWLFANGCEFKVGISFAKGFLRLCQEGKKLSGGVVKRRYTSVESRCNNEFLSNFFIIYETLRTELQSFLAAGAVLNISAMYCTYRWTYLHKTGICTLHLVPLRSRYVLNTFSESKSEFEAFYNGECAGMFSDMEFLLQ